jgi:hypothetical protein
VIEIWRVMVPTASPAKGEERSATVQDLGGSLPRLP